MGVCVLFWYYATDLSPRREREELALVKGSEESQERESVEHKDKVVKNMITIGMNFHQYIRHAYALSKALNAVFHVYRIIQYKKHPHLKCVTKIM